MKKLNRFLNCICFFLLTLAIWVCGNCVVFIARTGKTNMIPAMAVIFILANILPSALRRRFPSIRLRVCFHGTMCLKIFLASCVLSVIYHIVIAFYFFPGDWLLWLKSAGICAAVEAVLFWNGIISVYCSSVQLGIKHRVVGIICGLIPIVHLFVLFNIIKIVSDEVDFECDKEILNLSRKEEAVCRTKYPILLVHGVFFRDYNFPNYWGRIPGELIKNGAQIYYGNHHSASSVSESAHELADRIAGIVNETGCGKVNIIAHSKGGLDCRYALSKLGISEYVASLTTINTPHQGCEFADYLLNKVSAPMQNRIAMAYNSAMKHFGDTNPDFISAVRDLTSSRCRQLNAEMESGSYGGVYCQSAGSRLNRAAGGKFPLNFTYNLVKYFDGPNDGLVSEKAMRWGENFVFVTANGRRGISHGDMIDLNRENIPDFDVREFYVRLVADLKNRGL